MPLPKAPQGKTTEAVEKLHKDGFSMVEIASKLNVSKSSVDYHFRKLNLKPRRKGAKHHHGTVKHRESGKTYIEFDIQTAYATGRVEEFLRGHAARLSIPFGPLAEGVAAGLRAFARR
jgi:AcrR family transcriptional regulator